MVWLFQNGTVWNSSVWSNVHWAFLHIHRESWTPVSMVLCVILCNAQAAACQLHHYYIIVFEKSFFSAASGYSVWSDELLHLVTAFSTRDCWEARECLKLKLKEQVQLNARMMHTFSCRLFAYSLSTISAIMSHFNGAWLAASCKETSKGGALVEQQQHSSRHSAVDLAFHSACCNKINKKCWHAA